MSAPAGQLVALDLSPALFARLFDDETAARLRALNGDLSPSADHRGLGAATLVCITGWDTPPLTEADLDRAPNLRLIAHTGAAIHGLIPAECFAKGIRVSTAADILADSVAEYTVMVILAGLRGLVDLHQRLTAGEEWAGLAGPPYGHNLRAAKVGVVGASRVGVATIRLLTVFGADVLVYDPYLSPERADELCVSLRPLDELLSESYVVTLHAPLTPATRGMIGAGELALLRDGALLVNSARAGLVDSAALARELRAGRITACLDVFDVEPLPSEDPWLLMPNVVRTPHVAALTAETLFLQGRAMLEEAQRVLDGADLLHEVTAQMFRRMA